jgi:hypothetical protein
VVPSRARPRLARQGPGLPARKYPLDLLPARERPAGKAGIDLKELRIDPVEDPGPARFIVRDPPGNDQPVQHPVHPAVFLNEREEPEPGLIFHVEDVRPADTGQAGVDIRDPFFFPVGPVRRRELKHNARPLLVAHELHVELGATEHIFIEFKVIVLPGCFSHGY